MKVAVMGAGAVGCYFGAQLARAGHEVVLIGRPAHVEAIMRDGLHFESAGCDGYIRLNASTAPDAVSGADLVLFCVKSADTEEAGRQMLPHLASRCAIWSLQNGVDNADRLQEVLGRPVTPAVVYVAAEMAGAGHVLHHGRGELVIAPGDNNGELARLLTEASVPTTISDNVAGALWAKLILNCAYNALSAITQLPYGKLVSQPGVKDVIRDVVEECLGVANALGIVIPGDIWAAVEGIATTMAGQYSSTAQDLARGKRTEIDHLNGFVVDKAASVGLPTPVNRTLLTLVRLLETKAADGR
ncbi:2-dehydropantoate 2-reductase [Hartmannibacter diazotrophicus]|uniref:2-dehydropantoate 2-reductase n=1 Tax=Hartmannibacter diazotrophicus TaxID=1482074 RepID=A0A2C9D6F7_9HYPH|nr:2-dehydropantoate 2-reductase [Hartmannibacter diazotrophicus]SON55728.1 2-dehydropantoate 2-reductase [Hartmannibacter diazotrophicus]